MRMLCAAAAAAAAAYLWAVAFGDGVHGLKGAAALNNSNSFPDANVIFLIALAVYVSSPFFAAWWTNLPFVRNVLLKWFGATAIAGAALFATSRIFI